MTTSLPQSRIDQLARLGAKVTSPLPERMVNAIMMKKRQRKRTLKRVFKK